MGVDPGDHSGGQNSLQGLPPLHALAGEGGGDAVEGGVCGHIEGLGAAVMGDGNFDIVYDMAQTDRKMMAACGLNIMYGPQVDVSTDPRWPRNSGTYGERPEITAGITK